MNLQTIEESVDQSTFSKVGEIPAIVIKEISMEELYIPVNGTVLYFCVSIRELLF